MIIIHLLCNDCALYQITWVCLLLVAQFFQKLSLWGLLMGSDTILYQILATGVNRTEYCLGPLMAIL